jgi:tetratricopeptide (TPR) repeat protein
VVKSAIVIALTLVLLTACASTPPPVVAPPVAESGYLVNPRIGYKGTTPALVGKRFDEAWQSFLSGDLATAHQRFAALETPAYPPAFVGEAAAAIREGDLDQAQRLLDKARSAGGDYPAEQIYAAEVALSRGDLRRAFDLYDQALRSTEVPAISRSRELEIQKQLFEQLYARSLGAPDEEAIGLLRQALALLPSSEPARLLLVQHEVALRRFDEAEQDIQPMMTGAGAERASIQELLAEIDSGRGRFSEAIGRYERLSRRDPLPRYTQRLNALKAQWNAANMPAVYQRAVESQAITRADLAVLMYWQIAFIRFPKNLASPPIATDIDVPGREEIIRALALGLYQVDPVMRRVEPGRIVTGQALTRIAAHLLLLGGAPCSRQLPYDPSEQVRSQRALDACGISSAALDPAATSVAGHDARDLLERVAVAASAEQRQTR